MCQGGDFTNHNGTGVEAFFLQSINFFLLFQMFNLLRWEKHLWGQVQGRKLPAETYCKFCHYVDKKFRTSSSSQFWLVNVHSSHTIIYIHAGSWNSFHGQRRTSHQWQPVFHLHRYEVFSKDAYYNIYSQSKRNGWTGDMLFLVRLWTAWTL